MNKETTAKQLENVNIRRYLYAKAAVDRTEKMAEEWIQLGKTFRDAEYQMLVETEKARLRRKRQWLRGLLHD